MSKNNGSDRKPFAIKDLHPVLQRSASLLIVDLRKEVFQDWNKQFALVPFEGYRTPMRQHQLFAEGKATKARPWQSAHQYGLAIDFAGCRIENDMILPNTWFWPDSNHLCWQTLKRLAGRNGLAVPIAWDHGHVQHPLFQEVQFALRKNEWNWVA